MSSESRRDYGIRDPSQEELRPFIGWLRRTDNKGRIKVYSAMPQVHDDLHAMALDAVCVLEYELGFKGVEGGEPGPRWFTASEIEDIIVGQTENLDLARSVIGSLVDLGSSGYIALHSEADFYEGEYVSSGLYICINWPHLLEEWAQALEKSFAPDGHVYILGGGGYYKIGRAKTVDDRIKQLAIQLPWPVSVEHTIPAENHVAAEKALHEAFSAMRAHGEWFRLDEDELAFINSIKRMRGSDIER